MWDPVNVRGTIGMVFQRPNPFSHDVDLRQRGGRPETGPGQGQGKNLDDVVEKFVARTSGKRSRIAWTDLGRAVRRSAAAAVHRAGYRCGTAGPVDGRAGLALDPISTLAIEDPCTS